MSTVVMAMANEASCSIAVRDFSLIQSQRKLFTEVELNSLPGIDTTAIRSTIQYLHQQFLGEALASDDPEIDASYDLFVEVWQARLAAKKDAALISAAEVCIIENIDDPVISDPFQTLRSWAAVINYLLRDYKFIHE
jgi:hypothetical protein